MRSRLFEVGKCAHARTPNPPSIASKIVCIIWYAPAYFNAVPSKYFVLIPLPNGMAPDNFKSSVNAYDMQ